MIERLPAAGDDLAGPGSLDEGAREQARAGHEGEQDQPVENDDGARHANVGDRVDQPDGELRDDARDGDAADDRPHVLDRDVAPPVAVEPEEDEDEQSDRDDDRERLRHQVLVEDRDAAVEAEPEGEVPGGRQQARVGDDLPDAIPADELHRVTPTAAAESTRSTTCCCCSTEMPAHIGSARF